MGKNTQVTIKDLAREAGVSVSTVSRALNDSGRVSIATRRRVRELARQVGFVPDASAQTMRTQKSRTILLVVPDIDNPFYSRMAGALQKMAKDRRYVLTLFSTNEERGEEFHAIETARSLRVGGIVFASVSQDAEVIGGLDRLNIPTVLLNSYVGGAYDTVHGERNTGTLLSTRELIRRGHRRIGFAGGPSNTVIGVSRRTGYADALKEAGIPLDSRLMFEMGFTLEAGYKAGKYFSSLPERPTAVCCANDMIAMGVLSALYESGIPVPEEISVVGMDDLVYSRITNPPLTTVSNDSCEFARRGFELLLDRMEGGYDGPPREVVLPRRLIERSSVRDL